MPSADDDLPRLLSGRYRLEGTLGHGGMGVVYRGVDLMMKRQVAVKLIRSVDGVALDDEIAGRFLREAKNTARIQHEHIIEVFDFGRSDEGGMYFVMELLEGESLSARIRRAGAMSPQTTVHIGRQICEALQVAHTAGVIHRDLKPANVMLLRRAGVDDYVKVLDFGVAKSNAGDDQDQTQLTHTGMLVGTVDYMAPEQIMGKEVDGRTDVYALGVVLYKMLSGKNPFRDTGVPALIHAHINTMPKPLIEVVSGGDIPNELDRVVLRCLAKRPDRRYESMAELARALTMSIAPDSQSLISLEYANSSNQDPYAADDMTAVGRPQAPQAPQPPLSAEPPPSRKRLEEPVAVDDDSTFNENLGQFDDATIKIDRPLDFKKKLEQQDRPKQQPLPMTPRGSTSSPKLAGLRDMGALPPQIAHGPGFPPRASAPAYPEDVSTQKRLVPDVPDVPDDEITRADTAKSKTCAMCQTANPPHSRVCAACGVSLSMDDQAAVRARVLSQPPQLPQLPRTAHNPAPFMAPPVSGAFDMVPGVPPPRASAPSVHPSQAPSPMGGMNMNVNMNMSGSGSGPYAHMQPPQQRPPVGQPVPSPMHGVPAMQWLPHQPPPPPPPSMWQRFLRWLR